MDIKSLISLLHELSDKTEGADVITLNVYGGAALMLAYQCRKNVNDLDTTWSPQHTVTIRKAVRDISHTKKLDPRWLNNDIKDIALPNGTWQYLTQYGKIKVQVPSPEYMMALVVDALRSCKPSDNDEHPLGKAATDLKKLSVHLNWDNNTIVEKVSPFFPRGISPVSLSWLDLIVPPAKLDDTNSPDMY